MVRTSQAQTCSELSSAHCVKRGSRPSAEPDFIWAAGRVSLAIEAAGWTSDRHSGWHLMVAALPNGVFPRGPPPGRHPAVTLEMPPTGRLWLAVLADRAKNGAPLSVCQRDCFWGSSFSDGTTQTARDLPLTAVTSTPIHLPDGWSTVRSHTVPSLRSAGKPAGMLKAASGH